VLITDKNEVEIFPDSKKTIGIKKNTKSNVISRPNRTIIDNSEIKKGTDDFTQKVNPATKRAYNPAAASGTRPGSIQGRKSVISTKSGNDKPKK
jgi:hypothetical protein